jgi:branched-chain amino acid transport system substrate-binding protein
VRVQVSPASPDIMKSRSTRSSRLRRLLLAASVAGALLPGMAPAADEPQALLRIGVSVGLTGSYESIARLQQRAYLLWQKNVNERGGILGRRVQVVIRDDRSDPDAARKIYEAFVGEDRMDFVFGPYSSANTAAIAPIIDKHGYPTLASGATADALWRRGYRNLFGVYSPASRYAMGFLALMAEAGIQRVAIVSATDDFSVEASNGMRNWAPQYALHVASFTSVSKDKAELLRAAQLARHSGAQALLVAGHFTEAVDMRKALKEIGWMPSAYYATVGPAVDRYAQILGDDAEGTFSTSVWEPREDLRFALSPQFLREFVATYAETPSYHAATAYAAGQILEQAIRKARSFDRAKVRQALYLVDADSVVGRYAVDRTGMQVKRFPMIVQWQGTKREIVWPPELRTATPAIAK